MPGESISKDAQGAAAVSQKSFDGLDNRKAVMELFQRLGERYPEELAMRKRAEFLRGLLGMSTNGFKGKPMVVDDCSAIDAYLLFIAITNALGVSIERAAMRLENYVRMQA